MDTARVSERFDRFVARATARDGRGQTPYPYQRRLAVEGLPDVLDVPTGCGKTAAAVLSWLFRRREHPDRAVRVATPRRLALCLPMRVLVEQNAGAVLAWLEALGLVDEVAVYTMLGGEGRLDAAWKEQPEKDTVLVGTLDLLVSRALNRGYALGRRAWPVEFGLLHADTSWVLDEVQLMGPALTTTRQLAGLQRRYGTARPCTWTWMSATVDPEPLATVDNPGLGRVVRLSDEDAEGPLRMRLDAAKRLQELPAVAAKNHERALAEAAVAAHREGARTLVVCNTVARARSVHEWVAGSGAPAKVVLLHSRFRPGDRAARLREALEEPSATGTVVVTTQVLEAGVDVSAAVLLTECAPYDSVVQRAGRCNRTGAEHDARLLWVSPPKPQPYEAAELDLAAAALRGLDGRTVTPRTLAEQPVARFPVAHHVLRARDLEQLFDTTPDLGGFDVDVARFIREGDDLDAYVAWRDDDTLREPTPVAPMRDELCPVPVAELRDWLRKGSAGTRAAQTALRFDAQEERWLPARAGDVRPGLVLLAPASAGGYRAETGWSPASHDAVDPVMVADQPDPHGAVDEAVSGDRSTFTGPWVALTDHLMHVEAEVRELSRALGLVGLRSGHLEAAAIAARLHDVGKAHPAFQDMLASSAEPPDGGPWAKSSGRGGKNARPRFRHELVSALWLRHAPELLPDEAALTRYLVAAHHGVVRVGARSGLDEMPCEDGRRPLLGVCGGDSVPETEVPGGRLPESSLDLGWFRLGGDGDGSWTREVLALLARDDLGPFRLAFLEALVRIADWRASAVEARG